MTPLALTDEQLRAVLQAAKRVPHDARSEFLQEELKSSRRAQRSAIARKAAKARWRKPKLVEITKRSARSQRPVTWSVDQ
jgi:hypothetical protein